tara:strand:- start:290 stop:595 length:306 start_codon:yes stop_codon:yes gene_type:complete
MKDKRTYTHLKEHGEDMTHENESKVNPKEDRSSLDLTFIIEQHKKEIWEYKQKESEWIKTKNLADGYKKVIEELSAKLIDQIRVIAELEKEIERLVAENKK